MGDTTNKYSRLAGVLREAREFLARPENDFAWSSWKDAETALRELDALILRVEKDDLPQRSEIEFLFLPTGPIQEVSLSSGWGQEFLELAKRCDAAVRQTYGRDPRELEAHRAELAGQMEQLIGGSLRWFCTVMVVLSVGFAIYLEQAKEPVEVYFPLHLKGPDVGRAITLAAVAFGGLGAINWYSWLKRGRKK